MSALTCQFKLKPEIKERWVNALRSGKYRQGYESLCQLREGHKHYCCLGVLTDLFIQQCHSEGDTDINWERFGSEPNLLFMGGDMTLHEAIVLWAFDLDEEEQDYDLYEVGLNDPELMWHHPATHLNTSFHLSVLNDMKVPFDTIASLIEQQL